MSIIRNYGIKNNYAIYKNIQTAEEGFPDYPISVTTGTTGQIKYYNGSIFVAKPVKVWNGSAWVVKPLKRYNGSTWVTTPY